MRKCNLVGAAMLVVVTACPSVAQVPESPLGAALIQVGNSSGTGFLVTYSNFVFLVSAKHVVWNVKKTNEPLYGPELRCLLHSSPYAVGSNKVVFASDLLSANQAGDLRFHSSRDVFVLRVASVVPIVGRGSRLKMQPHTQQLTQGDQSVAPPPDALYSTRFDAAKPGDDVVLVGYPISLGLPDSPQIDVEEPLLRKAIIAGKNGRSRTLIVDAPAYFGNSGGPVWKISYEGIRNMNFSVVGVVTQFIPLQEEWVNAAYGLTNRYWSVSGYCVAEPMDFVIELLDGGNWR